MTKSKALKLSSIVLTILILFKACSTSPQVTTSFKDISVKAAHQLISKNDDNKNFVILDVRTSTEYENGHIEKAINLNYSSSDFKEYLKELDKNRIYLIYCQYGGRSKRALEIMKSLGFQKAYNLSEGIIGWESAGYSTIKEN
ncbi:MAG TPA: rhodanese-like domain-containing protein [bacterium]|nr:rhodanese-like domain-containing protein [bacterium]